MVLVIIAPSAVEPIRINGKTTWRVNDECVEVDASPWHSQHMSTVNDDWSGDQSGLSSEPVVIQPTAVQGRIAWRDGRWSFYGDPVRLYDVVVTYGGCGADPGIPGYGQLRGLAAAVGSGTGKQPHLASPAARWFQFVLGILLLSVGIALSIRAGLGTTPISTIPTVLAEATPFTVGAFTIAMNLVFVVLQLLLLRRRFPPFQLLQIPLTLIFGLMCDAALWATQWISPSHYLEQCLWMILSVIVAGLGVYVEVSARIAYLPGEGIVVVLHQLIRMRFGTLKQVFDWTLVLAAVALSFVLLGQLYGVREGTVLSAFGVGAMVKVFESLHSRWMIRRRGAGPPHAT